MIPLSYNLRNLAARKSTTFAAAFGLALVVFVFSAVQMLGNGIVKTLGRSADADSAIVMRKGATNELESFVDDPNVNLVLNDQAVSSGSGPRGVAEVNGVVLLDKLGTSGISNVQIRGIGPGSVEFRRGIKLVAGRVPSPGSDEAMVGKAIRGRFKGVDIEQSFELTKNRPIKVVGVFEDGGSSNESEIWTDMDNVRTAFKREGFVSAIRARVEPAKFDAFKTSVESNRQLNLQVLKESEYYEKQSEGVSLFIVAMGTIIAVFFSVGAMLGAMITMHAAVANRQREIGTLRALGFRRRTILLSFLVESIMLALLGGVIGGVCSLAMGLVKFSTVNWASFSEVVFSFEPTPGILIGAMVFATIMGILGGFFPAVRAARVSAVDAMRA